MKWRIDGADKKSGKDTFKVVEANSEDEAIKQASELYITKATPEKQAVSTANNVLNGAVCDEEEVVARLDNELVLTNKKLIQYKGSCWSSSTSLPLKHINFFQVRSQSWKIILFVLAAFFLVPGIVALTNGEVAGVAFLIISAIFIIAALKSKTTRVLVFSSSGGSQTFSYMIGSVVGMSINGISHRFNGQNTTIVAFLEHFHRLRNES